MWWMAAALAAPGSFSVVASEEAEIVVFPRVDAQRIDVGIYDNRVPLDEQLQGLSTRYLDQAWATSIGGGTWFVTLHVDPSVDLTWSHRDGRLRFDLAPSAVPVTEAPAAPTLDELLVDPPARRPEAPIPLTLHPLRGDASTLQLRPIDAFRGMPLVVTPHVPTYQSSLAAIDEYRALFTDPQASDDVRSAALARAGVTYTNLGLYREAVHYLTRAIESGKADAPVAFALARAEVARGRPLDALSACRYAARLRAQDEDVLACMVGISYIEPSLPASELSRALAQATRDPHRLLMAAQRLQADHRHDEALVLLERLAELDEPRVWASLGDALQATGDLPGAVDAWRAASRDRALRPTVDVRMRMAEWIAEGPSEFARAIPELLVLGDEGGEGSAESHYLLAQIAQVYGDPDLAAEQLNLLWAYHPDRALGSDVPERLVATCEFRIRQLEDQDRHVDLVSFFELCWRDELDGMVVEPSALSASSRSLAALGLADEALELQLRAVAMSTRVGTDDVGQLAWLAELYVQTERAREGLETLRFARQLEGATPELALQMAVTEGDAHLALGDETAAAKAWSRRDAPATLRRRALLAASQGNCASALPLLRQYPSDEATLAAARCLLRAGDARGASALIEALETDDSEAEADGGWLASVAAYAGVDGEGEPTGLWAQLLAEESESVRWAAERDLDLD